MAARVVVEVDPAYTSKTCSGCGHIFEDLTLKDRWITCRCGLSPDRDHNAAINILKRGGQLLWSLSAPCGVLLQEAAGLFTRAECHTIGERLAAGDHIQLRGFGTFQLREQAEHQGMIPKTNKLYPYRPSWRLPSGNCVAKANWCE